MEAQRQCQVQSVTFITPETFILRFSREGLTFQPGQYLSVGLAGHREQREYSIYSPLTADFLEILIRVVPDGKVSRQLAQTKPGDFLAVDGPFGYFLISEAQKQKPFLFIATGTGLSPFHCLTNSLPTLNYQFLHGVRHQEEQYGYADFDRSRLVSCVTGGGGDYQGRVTQYLRDHEWLSETQVYLCGNCDMIYDAFDLLKEKGIPSSQIFTEVYF